MISNFSSFIEFFAAVYVTMCIDNAYCKQFWTPVYYNEMNSLLSSYDFTASNLSIDKIKDEIESTNKRVQSYSQHKGSIMLCYCVVLLTFIGFEDSKDGISNYLPLIYCSLVVAILVVAPNFLLRSWRWVVFWLIVFAFLYYYITITNCQFLLNNPIVSLLYEHIRISLVVLISFPILHQLYLDWLYSRIYKAYLKDKIHDEYNKYKRSLEGIQYHQETLVHKHYKEACFKSCFSNRDDESDETLTLFNDVLRNRLLSAASPWQLTLLYSLFVHWIKVLRDKVILHFFHEEDDEEKQPNGEYDLSRFLIKDYSESYRDYLIEAKKPGGPKNIRAYCKAKGLSVEEMIIWVKKNKPKRKNMQD